MDDAESEAASNHNHAELKRKMTHKTQKTQNTQFTKKSLYYTSAFASHHEPDFAEIIEDEDEIMEDPDRLSVYTSTANDKWKGVFYMNIYCLMISFTFLFANYLFNRNPDMTSVQMLILRGSVATTMVILKVNSELKPAMYDKV